MTNNMMTDDPVLAELARLGETMDKRHSALVRELEATRQQADEIEKRMQRPGVAWGEARKPTTLGRAVVEAPEFKQWAAAGGIGKVLVRPKVETRAVTLDPASAGSAAPAEHVGIAPMPYRPLTIRDLIPTVGTTAGSIEFARQVTRDLLAAPVAEGALKPESNMAFELATAPVVTIAHWISVTRQALDDAEGMAAQIDADLRFGLAEAVDQQLLNGNGTPPNLLGLFPQATAYDTTYTVEGDTWTDVVAKAMMQLAESTGARATAVVLSPLAWTRIQVTKAVDGQYLGFGPFSAGPSTLWGVPVVVSTSMAVNAFLLGDFARAATVHERLGVEILVSSEHADYFTRNMLAIRAEQRLALAVRAPHLLIGGGFPAP